jgi:toxin ParE1/3/4
MIWSEEEFGMEAALRYDELIHRALDDIGEDPNRPGSKPHPAASDGTRVYHLSFSRKRIRGQRVKNPRHFLMYRQSEQTIEVLRLLHDSRDPATHLPPS